MEDKNLDKQFQVTGNTSNIIFGTSSDAIEQGLHNGQFVDSATSGSIDDKDQIVNEQEQNEIVNSSEETFNEEAPQSISIENNPRVQKPVEATQLEENVIYLDPDKDTIDNAGKISKAED